jgi:hypothetical protein
MWRVSFAVVVCIGCGDNNRAPLTSTHAPPPWQSGVRIRARLFVAEGFSTLAGWFDSELGSTCSVYEAQQDACIPFVYMFRYADAACTQPILEQSLSAAHVQGSDGKYYAVGDAFTGEEYYRDDSGCHDNGVHADGNHLLPIDKESLVELRSSFGASFDGIRYDATATTDGSLQVVTIDAPTDLEIEDSSARLRQMFVVAGEVRAAALAPAAERAGTLPQIYDAQLAHGCHPAQLETGPIRCFPDKDIEFTSAYDNDTCYAPPPDEIAFVSLGTTPGFYSQDANPDLDGVPYTNGLALYCSQPLTGTWWLRHDVGGGSFECVPLAVPALACDVLDPSSFVQLDYAVE